jgi:SPP1 gp7 family putative phage head morphogenesis protein
MEVSVKKGINYIISHWESTRIYAEPSLNDMFGATETFYRSVVSEAFRSCEEERIAMSGRRRLAKGPTGIPKRVKSLDQIFRNAKYWQSIMKRSNALTNRLKRQYLRKLKTKFDEIVPMMNSGEITPTEVKEHMISAWTASKPRVTTIFRTETTNYFGKTQVNFFQDDPDIIGFLFDSIRDSHRTKICKDRHGLIYRPGTKLLKENTPALFYNCRSHLIALANTAYNRKLLEDPDRDPTKRAVAPLPPGWRK